MYKMTSSGKLGYGKFIYFIKKGYTFKYWVRFYQKE